MSELTTFQPIPVTFNPGIDPSPISQSQLYEDLSAFIRLFKKMLHLAQTAISNIQKSEDYAQQLSKLSHCQSQCQSLETNTLHRFVRRLVEASTAYKITYQFANSGTTSRPFAILLRDIELAINRFHAEKKSLGRIVKDIHRAFMGFAVGVENAQGRVTMSHKSIDMDYERSMKQAENGLTELLKIENMVKPTSTSKILGELQNRFDSLNCLDLDWTSFKNAFFESRSNKDEFYQSCYERNWANSKLIDEYSDDFSLFMKRKGKKKIHGRRKLLEQNRLLRKQLSLEERKLLTTIQDEDDQKILEKSGNSQQELLADTIHELQSGFSRRGNRQIYRKIGHLFPNGTNMMQPMSPLTLKGKNKKAYKLRNVQITISKKSLLKHFPQDKTNKSTNHCKTQTDSQENIPDKAIMQRIHRVIMPAHIRNIGQGILGSKHPSRMLYKISVAEKCHQNGGEPQDKKKFNDEQLMQKYVSPPIMPFMFHSTTIRYKATQDHDKTTHEQNSYTPQSTQSPDPTLRTILSRANRFDRNQQRKVKQHNKIWNHPMQGLPQ